MLASKIYNRLLIRRYSHRDVINLISWKMYESNEDNKLIIDEIDLSWRIVAKGNVVYDRSYNIRGQFKYK